LLPYLFEISNFEDTSLDAVNALQQWDQQWQLHDDGRYGAEELILESWSKLLFERVFSDDIPPEKLALYTSTGNPNTHLGPSMRSSVGVKVIVRNLQALENGNLSYDFFNGTPPEAILKTTFEATIDQLVESHGVDLNDWSLASATMSWAPFNFRGVPQASGDRTLSVPAYMNRGSENNFFIARNGSFEAYDINPPGQSGFVSPANLPDQHASDQLEIYEHFEYKLLPSSAENAQAISVSTQKIDISFVSKR